MGIKLLTSAGGTGEAGKSKLEMTRECFFVGIGLWLSKYCWMRAQQNFKLHSKATCGDMNPFFFVWEEWIFMWCLSLWHVSISWIGHFGQEKAGVSWCPACIRRNLIMVSMVSGYRFPWVCRGISISAEHQMEPRLSWGWLQDVGASRFPLHSDWQWSSISGQYRFHSLSQQLFLPTQYASANHVYNKSLYF